MERIECFRFMTVNRGGQLKDTLPESIRSRGEPARGWHGLSSFSRRLPEVSRDEARLRSPEKGIVGLGVLRPVQFRRLPRPSGSVSDWSSVADEGCRL